jgi:uncharacterized protein YggE
MSTPEPSTVPSLLHVTEQAHGELRARAATLHVTLTATRFFSGKAALAKSEELRRLVEALREVGVPESEIALAGANLEVDTGVFSRSSTVTYRVRVHVTELDTVAGVLDAITSAKQATLTHIDWDHSGDGTEQLLADCAARAAAKARRLAAALGAALGSIHEVHEEEIVEPMAPSTLGGFDFDVRMARIVSASKARHKSIEQELAGLELAPPRPVSVRVRIAYRLSPASPPAP